MSEIKVNKLTPRTACGTTTLGDSGDTFNIPAGVTISNNGTATGFGATGAVNWDVSSIKTVDFTATSGVGYFVDTATTGAVIVTLPAAPAVGDVIGVADYANNFANANCTLNRNSLKIGGAASNAIMSTSGVAVTLVYVDVTKGWIVTDSGASSDAPGPLYVTASGGTPTTCGDYKIHTFTAPGTFTVSCQGNPSGSNTVEYLVVAGGGSGAAKGPGDAGGGGGAGGFRFASPSLAPLTFPGKPLNGCAALPVAATGYAVVVGGGGTGESNPGGPCATNGGGANGVDSSFSTITSTGGGRGSYNNPREAGTGFPGGSGGGGMSGTGPGPVQAGGTGNDPPTSPAQGTPGGPYQYASPNRQGGGGGGAICSGGTGATSPAKAGGDGAGLPTGFGANGESCGSYRYYAGGGAGGSGSVAAANGGKGGGGDGADPGGNGSCNTGGGGGGAAVHPGSSGGGNGGSGIVVIRYKYQ